MLLVMFSYYSLHAQDVVEWDGKYQIELSDFKSPTTQIGEGNIYSLYGGSSFDFAYQMANAEFMFTKNFNSKVTCKFNRNIASLVAPDSVRAMDMLLFARFEFDLAELYARKVRQRLYEVKGTFSNPTFFQPVFDQFQKEYGERHVLAGRVTDLGHDRKKLQALHSEVLIELDTYADFCKACKPPKKKKK
jgi:hypothetical protein